MKPSPGVGPIAFGRGQRDSKNFRNFLEREADEIAQLHNLGFLWMQGSQLIERFIHGERFLLVALGCRDLHVINIDVFRLTSAPFLSTLAPGALH